MKVIYDQQFWNRHTKQLKKIKLQICVILFFTPSSWDILTETRSSRPDFLLEKLTQPQDTQV